MTIERKKKAPRVDASGNSSSTSSDPLAAFREPTRVWFQEAFDGATDVQAKAFPVIASHQSALVLAPTGSGKTLAAFLTALDRIMCGPEIVRIKPAAALAAPSKVTAKGKRTPRARSASAREPKPVRVLYVSPLKALATDIERNLRAPIDGMLATAARLGLACREPVVAIRSGDTSPKARTELLKWGADILITTPESLYLILTSEVRKHLASVETVIVDEIHAVAATKRGSHLFLSLERLEALRATEAGPLQRIGLSATQRPLDVIARALAGVGIDGATRPVAIVDAGQRRSLSIRIEVPVEDMTKLPRESPSDDAASSSEPGERGDRSIWLAIHPRLVELIRAHRSTMIFVNNRRLSERLAGAINDLAGEEIALSHHGSIAHETRQIIENRLKSGNLPAIVATSSLELGIDMGAVDLVIQIEAPPSVSSGLQRIGRAGHRAGAISKGIVFPKYRGDLLACAAAARAMTEGLVELTKIPENALDVLAQQIVAMVSMDDWSEARLFQVVRSAAPYATLPRAAFEGVLDMLSGFYPSDAFAELRPRILWDRTEKKLSARSGARRVAILSGGTIVDRGLYGVYLRGEEGRSVRVGELDEEMVFESRPGEVFLLGATSWRIDEITHDRVIVTPAPGEPGKMPFWRGDRPGRPAEVGKRIGELARVLSRTTEKKATLLLETEHHLDARAAQNLVRYITEQRQATGEVPSDQVIVIERFRDEMGDLRVCVLSPYGARVHAPWAMAVCATARAKLGLELDVIWSDDGIIYRLPEVDQTPPNDLFLPDATEVEALVTRGLDQTSLFAGRFRENAARALLLPRRFPGRRTPLWAQRKRASDLLAVASQYGSFPIVLETYRECLRDALDLPALIDLLAQIRERHVKVVTVDAKVPSPFASALLFSYVANFIYDGDAPLAERRAQALSLDHERLRELLGEVELRELLDEQAIAEVEAHLQRTIGRKVQHGDALHDLLLSVGDLSPPQIALRVAERVDGDALAQELVKARRALFVVIGGERRLVAVEDIGRLRDALGIVPPKGLPEAFLAPVRDALGDLVSRYLRTHGPFTVAALASRYGLGASPVITVLERFSEAGRAISGGFVPGAEGAEWCDTEVLRSIKQKSLARLRKEVEPVGPEVLARFLLAWHEIDRPRAGLDAVVSVVEQLEGAPLPISALFDDILPSRVKGFRVSDLDYLCSTGEVSWRGLEPIGTSDGRVALHLRGRLSLLAPPVVFPESGVARAIVDLLERRGAVFFADIGAHVGGFGGELLEVLWELVWAGIVTNDTMAPLRSRLAVVEPSRRPRGRFERRRVSTPGSEGRWSLLPRETAVSETERAAALATVLLDRYGILTREAVLSEGVVGGYGAVYPVLKAMEEAGRARRGYFVAGLGAMQFARLGADDRLRALRGGEPNGELSALLAATDPANPYGATLPWPEIGEDRETRAEGRPQRAAGAHVVIHDGKLLGFLGRGDKALLTFLSREEPTRTTEAEALATALAGTVEAGSRKVLVIARIDGADATRSELARYLVDRGFTPSGKGLFKRRAGSFVRV